MRVFIAGDKGQLGSDLRSVLAGTHELSGADLPDLDITDPDSIRRACDPFVPDAIVNCAAFTAVDAAETERETAFRVNAEAMTLLGEYAHEKGARVVHISTDYVFDGARPIPEPYVESDPVGPVSVYGESKQEGECRLAEALPDHVILRTAWLYGANGRNFLKTILKAALAGHPLKVVNDQFGSPTWSFRLAEQIAAVLPTNLTGVAHATAEGYCTWYELAKRLLELVGIETSLTPCDHTAYPTPARRPANSILENARLKAAGLNVMRDWRLDLDLFVREHRDRLLKEARA